MMRSYLPMTMVLTAVSVASLLFVLKFRAHPASLDEIKSSLAVLRGRLPPNSTIGCRSYAPRPETENQVANAVAPIIVIPHVLTTDTTLFVFKNDVTDSMKAGILAARTALWEQRSDNYYFILARNTPK